MNLGGRERVLRLEVLAMADARYFARKAERCRELLMVARVPEVIEQLRLWAADFEAQATEQTERERCGSDGAPPLRHRTRQQRA